MKDTEDNTNRWKDIPSSCQYCQNDCTTQGNLQIQCNSYQITNGIFHRTRTKTFKICMEIQRPWIAKAMLRKKNGAGGVSLPEFRLYYQETIIKTVRYWCKNWTMDPQNRIESPEINPHVYCQLISDRGGKGEVFFFFNSTIANWDK